MEENLAPQFAFEIPLKKNYKAQILTQQLISNQIDNKQKYFQQQSLQEKYQIQLKTIDEDNSIVDYSKLKKYENDIILMIKQDQSKKIKKDKEFKKLFSKEQCSQNQFSQNELFSSLMNQQIMPNQRQSNGSRNNGGSDGSQSIYFSQ